MNFVGNSTGLSANSGIYQLIPWFISQFRDLSAKLDIYQPICVLQSFENVHLPINLVETLTSLIAKKKTTKPLVDLVIAKFSLPYYSLVS